MKTAIVCIHNREEQQQVITRLSQLARAIGCDEIVFVSDDPEVLLAINLPTARKLLVSDNSPPPDTEIVQVGRFPTTEVLRRAWKKLFNGNGND